MSINAVSSGQTGSLDQLVSQLLNTADTNKDGQLSISEFGALFASMLRGMGNGTSSASSAAAATVKAASSTPNYAPMAGFDTSKINDLSHTSPKYLFARAVQDTGLLNAATTSNLQTLVDYLNAQGATASVAGKDVIDFGGSVGKIDVIFDVGGPGANWQWNPTS